MAEADVVAQPATKLLLLVGLLACGIGVSFGSGPAPHPMCVLHN